MSGFDSCDLDLICMHVNEDLEGICVEYCQGTEVAATCSDPQAACNVTNEGALPVCLRSCDPLLPDCPQGLGCYGLGAPGEGAPLSCLLPGEGVDVLGLSPAACAPGETDVPDDLRSSCTDESEPCCTPWCLVGGVDPCGPGTTCLPWDDAGGDLGVCIDA